MKNNFLLRIDLHVNAISELEYLKFNEILITYAIN